MKIKKRDGRIVSFDSEKIVNAILAAFNEVDGEISNYAVLKANNIADYILEKCKEHKQIIYNELIEDGEDPKDNSKMYFDIETIQDMVEKGLMSTKRKDVAKAYIKYRDERNRYRGNLTDSTMLDYLEGKSDYWNSENSNKDAMIVTTQRDYMAGISSTDISRRKLLPKEVCEAHDLGIIHQHDMDYMAQNALTNCCLINAEDMLQNGTKINGKLIEKPHKLITATTIMTQFITAVASSQYGGSTVTLSALAPFVRDSFNRYVKKYENRGCDERTAKEWAFIDLQEEIESSVQTFNYQINTMSTTNGQAPFLSVVMWTAEDSEYEEELALLIEEFLKQRIIGMKNEKGVYVTPEFPKLLYVLDENNIHKDSKYYYLTKLAAECTAKRMVPDYISANKMREYKDGDVYGCMGKRKLQLM